MKKIILTLSIILIAFISKAQSTYPVTQGIGSATALVKEPNYGGLQAGFIPYNFTDTTQANSLLTYGKNYDGFQIKTTTPINATWWRDLANHVWVQNVPGGGGTGTQSWNQLGNPFILSDMSGYGIMGTIPANGLSLITNNIVRLSINTSGAYGIGSARDFGTSGYVLTSQGSGAAPIWASASGSTPTWQQTLDAGSDFNKNNIVNANGFDFVLDGGNDFKTIMGGTNQFFSNDSFFVRSGTTSVNSELLLQPDRIELHPLLGNVIIDTLLNLSAQNTIVGWTTTTGANRGKVGYITAGTGVSIDAGVLNVAGGGVNIYNGNGSLTANRTLTGATHNLTFTGLGQFEVDVSSVAYIINNTGGNALSIAGTSTSGAVHVLEVLGGASATTTLFDINADGSIIAPLLTNLSTQDRLVGYRNSSGQLGNITLAGSLSLSSGVLTGTGITGLTVGTTTIASGTTTRILYDNGGVLGEYTISGTGTTIPTTTSPSFVTSVIGGSSMGVFNTVSTTVNAFGAATTLNIGASATMVLNLGGSTSAAELRFLEPSASGTNYTAFKVAAQAGNITYTLPTTLLAGGVLTDAAGNGTLSWATPSSFALTNGSATTANGTAVDWGGVALAPISVDMSTFDLTLMDGALTFLTYVASTNVTTIGEGNSSISLDAVNRITTINGSLGTVLTSTAIQFSSFGAGAITSDGSGNLSSVSDRRAKHGIVPFTYGLNSILKLNTSSFIYNQDKSNTLMSGFIAQDVMKAIPIAVHNNNGGMMSLEVNAVVAANVNATKELYSMIVKQQKEIDDLKQRLKNK